MIFCTRILVRTARNYNIFANNQLRRASEQTSPIKHGQTFDLIVRRTEVRHCNRCNLATWNIYLKYSRKRAETPAVSDGDFPMSLQCSGMFVALLRRSATTDCMKRNGDWFKWEPAIKIE